jgi:hypothetical protein
MLLVCALTAALVMEIPEAIDRELKISANPAALLTVEQRTAIAHDLIVKDYEYLKTTQAKP